MYGYITEYYEYISEDNRRSSKKVRLSYMQLIEKYKKGKYTYDDNKAKHVIEFIEKFCKNSKGKWGGKNIELLLWQKAFVSALFGTINPKTGKRQFNRGVLYVARKNGKSVLASAIATYMLMADGESGAEVYSVATKRDQAKIVWSECLNMLQQSPALWKYIRKAKTTIYFDKAFAKHSYLGRDSNSSDGLNSSCILADETHAWTDQNLWDVMKDSMLAREQPLFLETSTAGTVRHHVWDKNYEYYSNLIEQPKKYTDDKIFAVMYELDYKDKWTQPQYWEQANPSLGVLIQVQALKDKVKEARQSHDTKNIRTKHFNIPETSVDAFFEWDYINNGLTYSFDESRPDGIKIPSYVIGGVDLSKTNDLTCARIVWTVDDMIYTKSQYFMLENKIDEREKVDRAPYRKWCELGYIKALPGESIDSREVTKWFRELQDGLDIRFVKVGYDGWSATQWVAEMKGNFGDIMHPVRQGAKSLSLPLQQLKKDFIAGKINYNSNPVDAWNFCNLIVRTDANGNIAPDKKSNGNKIDGVITMLNCAVVLAEFGDEYKLYL